MIEEIPDDVEWKNQTINSIDDDIDRNVWINAKSTMAMEIQAEKNLKKKVLPLEEQIAKEFYDFLDVFSEEKAACFPESRPWDHRIELKDTFTPKSFKMYNLTPQEQIKLDKFLKENLDKGYIQPSQSPMGSHFSLLTRRMENSDLVKIIDTLMNLRSRMPTLYH